MKEVDELERLKHILQSIEDIEVILKGVDNDLFYRNLEKKYAVERLLHIIGEAVNNISDGTLNAIENNIPWKEIRDFRIIVSHIYFRVDYTTVYSIATREMQKLKPVIEELIKKLETK